MSWRSVMRSSVVFGGLIGLVALSSARSSEAQILGLQRVASGLSAPIDVTHAPGDFSRLFIVQRGGRIRILGLNTGTLQTTPFLSIPSVEQEGEGGLLGLAFHPDYSAPGRPGTGKFYVNVTLDNGGDTSLGVT